MKMHIHTYLGGWDTGNFAHDIRYLDKSSRAIFDLLDKVEQTHV